MTRLKLSILCGLVMAGTVACWAIQNSARKQMRERSEHRRQQAEQLAQISVENERLSNQLAVARSPQSLSEAQLRELLKLRGQAGRAHQIRTEEDGLRAKNERLAAGLANSGTNQVYWTGDQLAPAGYAEPEAAMKSTLSAWISGDPGAFLASCTPADRVAMKKDLAGRTEAEFAALCKGMAGLYAAATEGVCILGKKSITQDEAVLELYFEGDGKSREFKLKKFGDEWKVTGLVFIFD